MYTCVYGSTDILTYLKSNKQFVCIFQIESINKQEYAIYENKKIVTCEIFYDGKRVHFTQGSDIS